MFRVAESKRQDVPLRRELPSCAPFESRIEAPGVGYLRVRSLPRTERASLAAALSDLERRGARKLLLDLRGAARGDMEDALRVAGLFLGDATVARSRERGGGEVEHTSRGPSVWKGSAFLLVNRGTAGAAEILSAALRDRAAARLLGERTCGLGARQDLIRLPSGDGLVLSVARYASPSGFVWHGEGLKEDIPIPLTAAPGAPEAEESQLRRALEIVVEEGRSGAARAA
jgi:carboxyl-terminal processing protease